MKKTCTLLSVLFLLAASTQLSAQNCPNNLLQNSNFSNGLSNWMTFSGFVPPPLTASSGCLDTFVVLRAANTPPKIGDGMEQFVSIDSGKCYNLCMCMANAFGVTTYNNVQFWALKNNFTLTFDSLLNNTYPPGDAQLIGIVPVNPPGAPQQYCINGWFATDSFTRLVIFNSTDSATAEVLIDNICLTASATCATCSSNLTAGFTYAANGLTVQFTNTSTINNGTITSYQWNFNDAGNAPNDTSSQQNPVYTFSAPGTYFVCMKAFAQSSTGPFCVDSFCLDVIVNNPVPSCDTTGNFSFNVNASTVNFTGISTGSPVGWSWNFGDPSSGTNDTSTLQNPAHVFTGPGSYNVCLTISYAGTSGTLCYDTICKTVVIGGSVGMNDIALTAFTMRPNPAKQYVEIEVAESTEMKLLDMTGRLIFNSVLQKGSNHILLKEVSTGYYIVRIGNYSKPLVVQ